MKTFNKSLLWDSILKTEIFRDIDVSKFKQDGANSKITQYNYKTHSILFLKSLIFQMANSFDAKEISLLLKIPKRNIGGGIIIDYNGISLDLDYLLALEEILFLCHKLKKIKSVLEIGAGYGRTCHAILSLFPNINKYTIIDLPQMFKLSKSYLKTVCTNVNFEKIHFTSALKCKKINSDLTINIDSMQEMDYKTAKSYLKYIDDSSSLFYSKNTIGKFEPELCGFVKSESSALAMSSGLLKEKINIFCPKELKKCQSRFLAKFLPSNKWMVEKHSDTLPWPHYYQALFVKNA